MGRAQNRKGFGWKRWSRQWLYETLRLFNGYRVRRPTSCITFSLLAKVHEVHHDFRVFG